MDYLKFIQDISSIATPFLLAYIAYITTSKNQLQAQLNDKKRENYENFIGMLVDAATNPKKAEQLTDKMFDFKKKLILFASPKSIQKFNTWMKNNDKNKYSDNYEILFKDIGAIILSLREEIGLSNFGLTELEILQVLIKDDLTKAFSHRK